MNNNIRNYAAKTTHFLVNTVRDAAMIHDDDIIQVERFAGMKKTIAALYDAKVKDNEIIRLVQKYYGVTEKEAQEQLITEKTIEHPCQELQSYLMQEKGLTPDNANQFIIERNIVEILKETPELWKVSPKELLKKIDDR